ncbi:MAG: hypothetical protein AB8B81_05535 [Halioglobus sp.]
MITWFARNFSRLSVTFITVLTLAACGGGGGGSDGPNFLPDRDDGNANNIRLLLEFVDSLGNPTDTVTTANPATLTVTVTEGPNPSVGTIVSAVTTSAVGLILPESGTALTDANGEAVFQVLPGPNFGATELRASVEVEGGEPIVASLTFRVERPDLRVGYFNGDTFIEGEIGLLTDSLSSSGSTLLRLAVVDSNGNEATTAEDIILRSQCVVDGLATLPEMVTTANGRATATYTATGCGGDDQISATLVNGGSQAFASINIASPQVNAINFVSATPELIALRGTGGSARQETSEVVFLVADGSGAPLSGQVVDFSLSTGIGGVALLNSSTVSDPMGQAIAQVTAGDVATPVRVIASIETTDNNGNPLNLSTISDVLIISSGLPDQNSISLSFETLNIAGAGSTDGLTTNVTVRMADKFNNPVPDGTSALFSTEYGSIGSSCTTVDGSCSVVWTSQEPRFPTFNLDLVKTTSNTNCPSILLNGTGPCPGDLGPIRGRRSTVLVTAIGEEFFVDANGNGVYDENEEFENLTEAFIDHNEDGEYTPVASPNDLSGSEETFVDFNGDGVFSQNVDPNTGMGVYNGILCPLVGDGVFCSRELVNVRASGTIVMSEGLDIIAVNSSGGKVSSLNENQSYTLYLADLYNNPPAGSASIGLSTKDDCEIVNNPVTSVPDSNAIGAFGIFVQIQGDGDVGGGSFTITAENGNITTSRTFPCITVPDPNVP